MDWHMYRVLVHFCVKESFPYFSVEPSPRNVHEFVCKMHYILYLEEKNEKNKKEFLQIWQNGWNFL